MRCSNDQPYIYLDPLRLPARRAQRVLYFKCDMPIISWSYNGETQGYYVMVNGESVFFTRDAYKRDMFIAELKGKIMPHLSVRIKSLCPHDINGVDGNTRVANDNQCQACPFFVVENLCDKEIQCSFPHQANYDNTWDKCIEEVN